MSCDDYNNGVVVQVHARPILLALKEVIEQEVQQMLKLGVIEESSSPWRSPLVLVPKPDVLLHRLQAPQ